MTSAKPWKTTKEIAREMLSIVETSQNPDLKQGFPTGLDHLDYHTGGIEKGQLWVIAAPSSCGKTLLMLQIVNSYLKASKHVLAFSFETGAGKLSLRNMSNNMEISANALNGKQGEKMTLNDNKRFKRGVDEMIEKDNLTICDDYDMTLEKMQAIASMRKKMGFQIDLIMVDYIQLVTLSDIQGKNREQQVAEISRTLKKMAKQHDCPVITASQLNDDGKTRESRAILQDSDVLLNIDPKSECIYLAKNRDGERGEALPYVMDGKYQRFIERRNDQQKVNTWTQ
jgi:replicative DNA helicase